MSQLIVSDSIEIEATPERVWEVLIDPKITVEYMFGCEAISEWKVGSPLIWKGKADGKVYVKGEIKKIETGKILEYTVFDPNGDIEDISANYLTVTYELLPGDGVTTLNVSQGDYSTVANGEKRFKDTVGGWGAILEQIKEIAEK